jgi:predicted nucleic acid-binding protein
MIAIVDSGPLYAAVDADDDDHARCVEVLQRPDLDLVIPALVVAEVTYLVGRRLGAEIEAAFLRGLADFEVEAPVGSDWPAIADLVSRYADFPLGGTDASVAVLAERLGTDLVVTLDRRHFGAIRSSQGSSFRLLPD